jgi:hypothetical protein
MPVASCAPCAARTVRQATALGQLLRAWPSIGIGTALTFFVLMAAGLSTTLLLARSAGAGNHGSGGREAAAPTS